MKNRRKKINSKRAKRGNATHTHTHRVCHASEISRFRCGSRSVCYPSSRSSPPRADSPPWLAALFVSRLPSAVTHVQTLIELLRRNVKC